MAELGGVSGVLGAESETSAEGSTPETPTPLDPTAAALAHLEAVEDLTKIRPRDLVFQTWDNRPTSQNDLAGMATVYLKVRRRL